MQVASTTPHGASPLSSYFNVSPNGFAFTSPCPEQIMDRRAELDDKLIFDILLSSGGIRDPEFLYPPRDPEGLERLLDAIQNSTYDTLKKHTLIYFLLKWCRDGREDAFKLKLGIPPQFSALADAYWYLDAGVNLGQAVSILSDARLNRDFASKIIHALTLSPQPGPLILRYVRTAKPPLVEPPDMLRYIGALVESSVFEAWQYQRSFSESDEMRPRLFKRILDWAITPSPKPNALKDLISLPLSKFEQDLLNEYALQPPQEYKPTSVSILQDLVCVRYIELGKYIDAIKLDRKFSATGSESSDRRTMIRELYDSLPPVEKSLIDTDDIPRPDKPQALASMSVARPIRPAAPAADVSMSQSWEEVLPEVITAKSISTPLRKIQVPSATPVVAQPKFTVPTSVNAPEASANGAGAAAAPLLPVSNAAPSPPPSLSAFTSRKSQQPLSSLGKGRPSLSGVGQKIAAFGGVASISSPVSGMRFPVGSSKPPSTSAHGSSSVTAQPKFVSTTNRENAFFQPKQTAQKRPAPEEDDAPMEDTPVRSASAGPKQREEEEEAPPAISINDEADDGMEVDEGERKQEKVEEPSSPWRDMDSGNELSQSIFSGAASLAPVASSARSRSHRASAGGAVPAATSARSSSARQQKRQKQEKPLQPPGAFGGDDEHEGGDEEEADEPEPAPAPSRSRRAPAARATRASKEPSVAPTPKPATRRIHQIKEKDFGRSIPGSLMDDDEEDEEAEEEQDTLAPLREPTPPPVTTAKRAVRRAKSVVSVAGSDAGSDGEGVGLSTRRRSSRLSTTGTVKDLSAAGETTSTPKVPGSARKAGRASTTSKRKK